MNDEVQKIYDKPTDYKEVAQKRRDLRKQRAELYRQPMVYATCPCGSRGVLKNMYRCWFCELIFCSKCAKEHFGEEPPLTDIGLLKGEIR